jgi:HSP20 family molecular chaperone IbpA
MQFPGGVWTRPGNRITEIECQALGYTKGGVVMETDANQSPTTDKQARHSNYKKSKLAIGGTAILAIGVLIGFVLTRYATGTPAAMAATKTPLERSPTAVAPGRHAVAPGEWNPFQEIRSMQSQMDQMFNQMTTEFRAEPRLSLFSDTPGYSLSLRVQDMKDHYQVRAYLPDAKASDVKVSLLDKRTLKVEVSNHATETAAQKNEHISEWGQYAQIITLPGPVKNEQMKIDQSNHQLLITLPKA